jgi:hypothetical protein
MQKALETLSRSAKTEESAVRTVRYPKVTGSLFDSASGRQFARIMKRVEDDRSVTELRANYVIAPPAKLRY